MSRRYSSNFARRFTLEEIEPAIAESLGFCIACGAESGTVEPDARRYECESCGEKKVYGAEQLVIMGLVS